MTPFELAYGRRPATILDAMLLHVGEDDLNADLQGYLQRAEEARQLARFHTTDQQLMDARRTTSDAETPSTAQGIVCGFGLPSDDVDSVRNFYDGISDPTGFYNVLATLRKR